MNTNFNSFWNQIGELRAIKDIVQVRDKIDTSKLRKKYIYYSQNDKNYTPLFFELVITKNTNEKKWIMLDFDIKLKEYQKILSSNLKIFENLPCAYFEKSINGGLHFLVCVDSSVSSFHHIKKPISVNNKPQTIVVEFKHKCLVFPSKGYEAIFFKKKSFLLSNDHLMKFIEQVFILLEKNGNIKFENLNLDYNLPKDFKFDDHIEERTVELNNFRTESTKKHFEKHGLYQALSNSNKNHININHENDPNTNDILKRKHTNHKERTVDKNLKKSRIDINHNTESGSDLPMICEKHADEISSLLYNIRKSLAFDEYENLHFELLKNLDHFYQYISKLNKFDIYFGDLQEFLISFISDNNEEREDVFASLSDTENWVKWTKSYLELIKSFEQSGNSISYRSSKILDPHSLYRSITIRNSIGANLSDRESKDEVFGTCNSQIKVTKNLPFFQRFHPDGPKTYIYPTTAFIKFVLITLSVLALSSSSLIRFIKFINIYCEPKQKKKYNLYIFQKVLGQYGFQILKLKNPTKTLDILPNTFINIRGLPWYSLTSIFFNDMLSIIFPNLDSNMLQQLKLEISDMGLAVNMSEEMINIRTKLKQYSKILNFKNCKVLLKHQSEYPDEYCGLLIDNYYMNDCATEMGVINYSFDFNDYLSKGIDKNILSLNNEERYGSEWCSLIRTIFGQDSLSGNMTIFGCTQFLIDTICFGALFLKNKVLQSMCVYLGPGGTGKSFFMHLKNSIFMDLIKWRDLKDIFKSGEMCSGLSNLAECYGIFFSENEDKVSKSHFNFQISEQSPFASYKRNMYATHSEQDTNNSVSYHVSSNSGLAYEDKSNDSRYFIDDSFIRRQLILRIQNLLGGMDVGEDGSPTYYSEIRNFKLASIGTPEFDNIRQGYLYYCLDMIQYIGIGSFYDNKYIRTCLSNRRFGMSKQFLPIKILRESLIFIDEIYTENCHELADHRENYNKLIKLKDALQVTGEFQPQQLTDFNLDKIAKELNNKFGLNVKKDVAINEWYINDVIKLSTVDEKKKLRYENPSSYDYPLLDEQNPQKNLPPALRFFVSKRIEKKFNYLLVNIYNDINKRPKINNTIKATTDYSLKDSEKFFFIPKMAPNIRSYTSDDFVKNLRKSLVKTRQT